MLYAWRHSAAYDIIWWLRAEDGSTLASDYDALATELELPEKEAQEQAVTINAVKKRLDHNPNWLLIFDNARDSESIQRFGGLRWRGLFALNFIRRTELPPCTNVSAKYGTPAIVNPLLCTGLC